ncbi:MAG: hypothetical protein IJY09_03110 [Lachnospiraceae bacterium]|nr:hypothetical protein [Lachnospiraceae bacterium]
MLGTKFKGFSAAQLKVIALIAMTMDHLAAYGFPIPLFGENEALLRAIGRIAAPVFLFVLTESIRYTRSKGKFLLRLYLGAVGVGLFTTITNALFLDTIGKFRQSNILFDYFYVTLYIILLEELIEAIKKRNWKKGILMVAGIAATYIPHYLSELVYTLPLAEHGIGFRQAWIFYDVVESFVQSPIHGEYPVAFVIAGVLMYFVKSKYPKAIILVLYSIVYFVNSYIGILQGLSLSNFLGSMEFYTIFAVPIVLLYNGEKGKGGKYFFYLYYPLHRYVISIIVYLYGIWSGM